MPTQTQQPAQEFPSPPRREVLAPPPAQKVRAPSKSDSGGVGFLSIEGLVVLMWAVLLDIAGIVLSLLMPGLGFIPTILGVPTIGLWAYYRGGGGSFSKKMKRFLKRGVTTMAAETLTTGIVPGWTLLVLMTYKKLV